MAENPKSDVVFAGTEDDNNFAANFLHLSRKPNETDPLEEELKAQEASAAAVKIEMPPTVPSRLAKQYSNLIEGVGENEMFSGLEKSDSPI